MPSVPKNDALIVIKADLRKVCRQFGDADRAKRAKLLEKADEHIDRWLKVSRPEVLPIDWERLGVEDDGLG